jgi:inorganic pyrophosphatase
VEVDGWYPREEALEAIEEARGRWRDAQKEGA